MDFDLATGYITFRGTLDLLEKDIQQAEQKVKQLDNTLNKPAGKQKFEMALHAARGINAELAKSKAAADRLAQSILGPTQKQLELQRRQAIIAENRQHREESWLDRRAYREAKALDKQRTSAENRQHRDESWLARRENREAKAAERQRIAAESRQNRDENWLAKREIKETRAAEKAEQRAKRQGMTGVRNFGLGATALAGGALALGAGSSPLAQSTLQGSWELFRKELGGSFAPLVKDVSQGLQNASRAIRDMPKELKSAASEGAKFTMVAGGLALGLAAIHKGFTALAAHPVIAALAGIGAGMNLAANANAKQAEAVEAGQQTIFSTTRGEALRSAMGTRLAMLKPDRAAKEAKENFRISWLKYEQAREEHKAVYDGVLSGPMSAIVESMGLPSKEMAKRAEVIQAGRKLEESKYLYREFGGAKLKERAAGTSKKDNILWGDMGPVSSMGVADLFKSFQAAGLRGGLAGAIAKTDAENQLELLGSIDKKLGDIRDKGTVVAP